MPKPRFDLADRLEHQAGNVENDGHLNAARYMREAAAALRLSATSPGDAVRMREAENRCLNAIDHVGLANYSERIVEARQWVREAFAALAPAEKAGDYSDLTNPELSEVLSDLADFHHEDAAIAALAEAKRRLDATPTPPSGDDVAWLIAEIESKKIHYPADPDKLARFNRIKASIQSAAHGGGTKSDGGVESRHAFENGRIDDCKTFGGIVHPLSPSASDTAGVAPGPSDPAQEPEAVAWRATYANGETFLLTDKPTGDSGVYRCEALYTRPALDREALTESNISHEICHVFGCRETCDAECNADHGRSKCGEAARRIIALLEGRT